LNLPQGLFFTQAFAVPIGNLRLPFEIYLDQEHLFLERQGNSLFR
jgi:hypothetical protein